MVASRIAEARSETWARNRPRQAAADAWRAGRTNASGRHASAGAWDFAKVAVFPQRDPLDSPIGEPHGDKKKSDDNGGPGVPDGVTQFAPAVPNGAATGTPITLATVEQPQQATWDNGFDENVAKRFGATRHVSVADLGVKLAIDTTKTTRRIQHLVVGGHGNASMLAAGSGDGPDVTDALNVKPSNKATWLPFFNSDKFYGRAEIWIMSCNVGNGSIPQLIADRSGCTVYAYTRTAYATEASPFLNERTK